jgi:hypothetical protein
MGIAQLLLLPPQTLTHEWHPSRDYVLRKGWALLTPVPLAEPTMVTEMVAEKGSPSAA